MADKMNIRFRIKAVDAFTKTMKNLDRQLSKIKRDTNSLPNKEVRVTADTKKFDNKLKQMEIDLRLLEDIDINVDADAKGALKEIKKLDKTMNKFEKELELEMELDTDGSEENLAKLTQAMDKVNDYRRKISRIESDVRVEFEADTAQFQRKLKGIKTDMALLSDISIEADADVKKATTGINKLQNQLQRMEKEIEIELSTETNKSMRDVKSLRKALTDVQREASLLDKMSTDIDIDIEAYGAAKAEREINELDRELRGLPRLRTIFVNVVVAPLDELRSKLGRMATVMRNVGELVRHELISAFIALSPVAASSIGVITGGLGAVGPMIGTVAGGVMGLGSAFASAGTGAVAFGALAAGALGKVFGVSEDVKRLQERLATETDDEKRAEILEEIATVQGTLNAEQERAYSSLNDMKSVWGDIVKQNESGVISAFTKSMSALSTVLEKSRPIFEGSVTAANNLMDALNRNLNTEDVASTFEWLGETAGPAMETLGKALGNFGVGVGNLLRAFAPLGVEMQEGFLGMSESFREWTDSLSGSEKFQSFISFVQTNGPKLLDIFGSLTVGLVDMFAAFGPLSSDMMTGLQDLINRFQEWASTLSENKQFQEFINFVQENGPTFVSFIGKLITFLVNLGIGFAQVGEKIMPLINKFLDWANSGMEGNRTIALVIAAVTSLGGVISFLLPWVILIIGRFGAVWTAMSKVWSFISANLLPIFTKLYLFFHKNIVPILAKIGNFVMTKVVPAISKFRGVLGKVLPWIIRIGGKLKWFVGGPVTLVIGIVIELAVVIFKYWDEIKAWTIKTFDKVWGTIKDAWDLIWYKIQMVIAIFNLIKGTFRKIKNEIADRMSDVWNDITDVWDDVMAFLRGIDLSEMGEDIIQGLINGIKNMAGSVVSAAKGVVEGAIGGAKKLLGISSPSKVFQQIGVFTGEGFVGGMDDMNKKVKSASERMSQASVPSVRPSDVGKLRRERGYDRNETNPKATGNTITQNLHFYGESARTPSKTARKHKQAARDVAMEARF